jgi:hypothetical protein
MSAPDMSKLTARLARRGDSRHFPRWPLYLIGAPAAVVIWSGWVGLGGLCGFGPVHLLPGIAPHFVVNTAITLPVGIEAYGAYALGAWLTPRKVSRQVRQYAMYSSIGALALGMLAQVIYHLLVAEHATRAPAPVVVLVSCLPVLAIGFGTALAHMIGAPSPVPGTRTSSAVPVPAVPGAAYPGPAPAAVPARRTQSASPVPARGSADVPAKVTNAAAQERYAALLAEGRLPGIQKIKRELHVGQDRAGEIQRYLKSVAEGHPGLTAVDDPR